MTYQAVFEGGVFRPTQPVDLPDGSVVTVNPADESPEVEAHRLRVIELLSQSFNTDQPDLAARHNEHQP